MNIDVGRHDVILVGLPIGCTTDGTANRNFCRLAKRSILVYIDFRIRGKIEDSIIRIVQITNDTANSADIGCCIFLLMVGNFGISDDDVAHFCIINQVAGNDTYFYRTRSGWKFILLSFQTCVLDNQVGNCGIVVLVFSLQS